MPLPRIIALNEKKISRWMDEELLFLRSTFIEQRILSCLLLRSTQQVRTFITRFYDLTERYGAWAGPGSPAAAAYCRCQNPCVNNTL